MCKVCIVSGSGSRVGILREVHVTDDYSVNCLMRVGSVHYGNPVVYVPAGTVIKKLWVNILNMGWHCDHIEGDNEHFLVKEVDFDGIVSTGILIPHYTLNDSKSIDELYGIHKAHQ